MLRVTTFALLRVKIVVEVIEPRAIELASLKVVLLALSGAKAQAEVKSLSDLPKLQVCLFYKALKIYIIKYNS